MKVRFAVYRVDCGIGRPVLVGHGTRRWCRETASMFTAIWHFRTYWPAFYYVKREVKP
jgi:hypothetical protein